MWCATLLCSKLVVILLSIQAQTFILTVDIVTWSENIQSSKNVQIGCKQSRPFALSDVEVTKKKRGCPAVTLLIKERGLVDISLDLVPCLVVRSSWPSFTQDGLKIQSWLGTKVRLQYRWLPYYLVPKYVGKGTAESGGVLAKGKKLQVHKVVPCSGATVTALPKHIFWGQENETDEGRTCKLGFKSGILLWGHGGNHCSTIPS